MLKNKHGNRLAFAATVLVGAILIFVAWPSAREMACIGQNEHRVRPSDQTQHADAHQNHASTVDKHDLPVPAIGGPSEQSNESHGTVEPVQNDYGAYKLLCGETRLTDLGLVFFTYSLAVVGWYAMQSNERTLRDIERAHFVLSIPSPITVELGQKMTVRVGVVNHGRTLGFLKEIYGDFTINEPAGKRPRYLNSKDNPRRFDLPMQASEPRQAMVSLAVFETTITTECFFFGYVRYEDTFRAGHTNRFCVKLVPGSAPRYEPAGTRAWNTWD